MADNFVAAGIVLPNPAGNSLPGPSQGRNIDKRRKRVRPSSPVLIKSQEVVRPQPRFLVMSRVNESEGLKCVSPFILERVINGAAKSEVSIRKLHSVLLPAQAVHLSTNQTNALEFGKGFDHLEELEIAGNLKWLRKNWNKYPPDCKLEHRCPKRCFENCGKCVVKVERKLPCGHLVHLPCHVDYKLYKCTVNVAVTLPHCEHPAEKPCYCDLATFPCPRPCEDRLPCGHSCELKCHVLRDPDHLLYKCSKPCAKLNAGCIKKHPCAKRCHEACASCAVPVKKTLACGHTHMVECSKELAEVICKRDCRRILPCNHKCKLPCHKPCGDCQKKVVKVLPECKHQQMVSCSESPDPAKCKRRCVRELPCGHRCTGICNKRCDNPCKELVTCSVSPACGHIVQVPCHMQASGYTFVLILAAPMWNHKIGLLPFRTNTDWTCLVQLETPRVNCRSPLMYSPAVPQFRRALVVLPTTLWDPPEM
uniref:NFX1-type zinc finger-containing protein 1 n=1 Tax=Timema cristinae TaxID=61476 RepID=A0A7R9D9P2_TIMCR|nr:unnamed protein product [Timema cristinae]